MGPTRTTRSRFVLVAVSRSGSTALIDALGTHPALRPVVWEPFNPTHVPDAVASYCAALFGGPPDARQTDYTRAFGWLFQTCAGFKIMDYQCPAGNPTWSALSGWPGVRLVVVARRNLIDRYASQVLAATLGVWHSDAAIRRFPVLPLPIADVVRDVAARAAWLEHATRTLPDAPVVYHEDLIADFDGAVATVQRWLGVRERRLAPRVVKTGPLDYRQIVPNYDALVAACADAGYAAHVAPGTGRP